jgi:hypothetical protein
VSASGQLGPDHHVGEAIACSDRCRPRRRRSDGGIQFVTNDKGEKVAVLIDLARHGEMWEDIYDQLLAGERANDKRLPYETVRRRLVRSGKLRA